MKIKADSAERLLSLQSELKTIDGYIEKLEELLASHGEFYICVQHEEYRGGSHDCGYDHYNYSMSFPREASFIQPMIDHWQSKRVDVQERIQALGID